MRKTVTTMAILFLVIIIGAACSTDIKEKTYSSETVDLVQASDQLTGNEKKLFSSAVTFASNQNQSLEGKTVSAIIIDESNRQEEERQKEEERKRELVRQKEEEKRELQNAIQITLDGKSVIPENFDAWQFNDVITFELTFKNTTSKDVRGFKGTSVYKDLFGDTIKKINISYDEGIKANDERKWEGYYEVNQFIQDDIKLRDIDFQNLQFEFQMETIVYD